MQRLVFDLDGTLTHDEEGGDYLERRPNLAMIAKLREYREQGFTIIVATSRNMRTHGNSVGIINAKTLPTVIEWLNRHDIPFDEIHVAKPWCGFEGFYVDDKAIRPSEFRDLTYDQIRDLLREEAEKLQ